MRLPRDVSADRLIHSLKSLEYEPTRQAGSHIRLTTPLDGTHHITIPRHDPLKLGTLAAVLDDIARHHKMKRDDLLAVLKL